jgi:hypothetical protein
MSAVLLLGYRLTPIADHRKGIVAGKFEPLFKK